MERLSEEFVFVNWVIVRRPRRQRCRPVVRRGANHKAVTNGELRERYRSAVVSAFAAVQEEVRDVEEEILDAYYAHGYACCSEDEEDDDGDGYYYDDEEFLGSMVGSEAADQGKRIAQVFSGFFGSLQKIMNQIRVGLLGLGVRALESLDPGTYTLDLGSLFERRQKFCLVYQ